MSRGWVLPLHSTALSQPRPQGFSLKKWVGLFPPHPFFKGKALGTRLVSIRMGTFLTDTTAFSAGMYMLRASRKSIEIQRHCITERSILCRLSFSNCKSCVYNCDDLHSYNHFTPQFTYTIFIYS